MQPQAAGERAPSGRQRPTCPLGRQQAHLAAQRAIPVVLDGVVGTAFEVLRHACPLRARGAGGRAADKHAWAGFPWFAQSGLAPPAWPSSSANAAARSGRQTLAWRHMSANTAWHGLITASCAPGGPATGIQTRACPASWRTWLPYFRWKRTMISSSCRVHWPRLMAGFRWLCQLRGRGERAHTGGQKQGSRSNVRPFVPTISQTMPTLAVGLQGLVLVSKAHCSAPTVHGRQQAALECRLLGLVLLGRLA